MPEGVTSIPSYAFRDCSSLKTVIISESTSSIGTYAFNSCTGLKNIWIGSKVNSIGENAFTSCTALTIHGVSGSYAENYANSNSIPFSSSSLNVAKVNFEGTILMIGGGSATDVSISVFDCTENETIAIVSSDSLGTVSYTHLRAHET